MLLQTTDRHSQLPLQGRVVKLLLVLIVIIMSTGCSLFFSSNDSAWISAGKRPKLGTAMRSVREGSRAATILGAHFGRLEVPVLRARKTSTFGPRGRSFHHGVDLAARTGTEVVAAHDGLVILSGSPMSGYGNMIILRNGDFYTVYAHNKRNLVRAGDSVSRGDSIAEVGSTGRATGPHLHYEIRVDEGDGVLRSINPEMLYVNGL